MRKSRLAFALVCSLVILASGCIRRPKGVLSDKDMAPVLADLELADAYLKSNPTDKNEMREALLTDILARHKVSRADYDSTMAWYARNVDQYYEVCDLVNKELLKKKTAMTGEIAGQEEANDLWPGIKMSVVLPNSISDGIDFSMPTARVEKGERLQWRMRFNEMAGGTALLGVEYDNGRKAFTSSSLRGKQMELKLQTDTNFSVIRVFGNVAFEKGTRLPLWADSISLSKLPFDSLEYYHINSQRIYREPAKIRVEKYDSIQSRQNNADIPH